MKTAKLDFLQWMERCAADLNSIGRYGQAINYRKAVRSFSRFLDSEGALRPPVGDITSTLIRRYNRWLERTGVSSNSISFYNRQLRAVYNKAVKKGLVKDVRPFCEAYTGVGKTEKRAVSLGEISRICSVVDGETSMARDLFEFSFSTCGMSFADIAYLRKSDITGGVLRYRRRKTGAQVCVPLTEKAERILRKYGPETRDSLYAFPILGGAEGEEAYRRYLSALTSYNRALKRIAHTAGTGGRLTSYVARHSWATAARNSGASVTVISTALGHSSERTTQIYLDSMDTAVIGGVNMKIMRKMSPGKRKMVLLKNHFYAANI